MISSDGVTGISKIIKQSVNTLWGGQESIFVSVDIHLISNGQILIWNYKNAVQVHFQEKEINKFQSNLISHSNITTFGLSTYQDSDRKTAKQITAWSNQKANFQFHIKDE